MKKLLFSLLAVATLGTGCAYIEGGTDLSDVADASGLSNVTTGDGTFENYTATGYYTGTEVGIGVGLPGIGTFIELYPAQTNEKQLEGVATTAKEDGANAMINVDPPSDFYTGIPFFIVGIYVNSTAGTGIKSK